MKSRMVTALVLALLALPLVVSAQTVVFSDNFNRTDSTNIGAGWTERAGDWQIIANVLRPPVGNDSIITANAPTNGVVSARLYNRDTDYLQAVGVIARAGNYATNGLPQAGYAVMLHGNGQVALWNLNGLVMLGNYIVPSYTAGTWVTLALRVNGSTLQVDVNGTQAISVSNTAATSGNAGLYDYHQTVAGNHQVDDFSITDLSGATPTRTFTSAPPTNTNTPTSTWTPLPPTNTPTSTATSAPPTSTNTPTSTVFPPTSTNTPTSTPIPPTNTPTATGTVAPPTPTNTATATRTVTVAPPTSTNTPTPPVVTPTPRWNVDVYPYPTGTQVTSTLLTLSIAVPFPIQQCETIGNTPCTIYRTVFSEIVVDPDAWYKYVSPSGATFEFYIPAGVEYWYQVLPQ